MITPHSLRVLADPLRKQGKKIGEVTLKYPPVKIDDNTDDSEYDEDEQLFAAISNSTLKKKYSDESIPLVLHDDSIVLTIPNFGNTISFNILAKLLTTAINPDYWITLAPSNLNNNQTISKLFVDNDLNTSLLSQIPNLKPPHTVTGISAAIISQLNYTAKSNYVLIVLNSEGHPGFEKTDSDAIVDSAYVLATICSLDKEYLQEISKLIRKFNPYSNSGMYL